MRRLFDLPYLLLTLTALFWAGNMVIGRGIRGDVPPLGLAFWRWTLALLITLPLALPYMRQQWPALRRPLKRVEALGVSVSVIGVLVVVTRGNLARVAELQLNPGDLWMLVAVIVWGLYTVGLHWLPKGVDPMLMLAAMMLVGVIVLAPAWAWELSQKRHIALNAGSFSAIAYTAIFPSFLGYVFYNRGVAMVGPSHSVLFLNLTPVFATVLSILFLDELPVLYHGIGIALILAGIWLTTRVARVSA